jgi:anti-anti-sigma factor
VTGDVGDPALPALSDPVGRQVNPPQLRTEHIGSALVAHLSGDVDLSNVNALRTRLLGIVDDVDALVVNLSDTGYVDSTGVRLLFELAERFGRTGNTVRAVVPAEALVRRVVVLTKLDRVVELHETVGDALASLEAS